MPMTGRTETTVLAPTSVDGHLGCQWHPPAFRPQARHLIRPAALFLLILAPVFPAAISLSHTVRLSALDSPLAGRPSTPSAASPSGAPPPWTPPAGSHRPALRPAQLPRSSGPVSTSLDLSALATEVDPAVVDINTVLSTPNAQAAGTGIVLDSSGVVLTNNHVISGATSISVTDIGTRQSYPATVIGYDRTHDIAVLQLQGAAGLPTAQIGDSSALAVGEAIAAIGNAGGRGGSPAIAAGTITALGQTVTVSDGATASAEQLTGLIQVAADVQPGDSGGPLVTSAGQVIGVDTAGSAGTRSRFGSSGGEGLAIPINDALAISTQIRAGTASPTIHIGPTGILGITVQGSNTQAGPTQRGWYRNRHRNTTPVLPGALVISVMPGSPAEPAGLTAGDTIVSLDSTAVDSPATLTTLLSTHHPGDTVQLSWLDPTGQRHTAAIQLATGPPN